MKRSEKFGKTREREKEEIFRVNCEKRDPLIFNEAHRRVRFELYRISYSLVAEHEK